MVFPNEGDRPLDGSEEGDSLERIVIPADAIRAVLLNPDLVPDPRGLMIRGATIAGSMDLDRVTSPCQLVITQSEFLGPIRMEECSIPRLDLTDCKLVRVDLTRAKIPGNLMLSRITAEQGIHANAARIGGRLTMHGSILRSDQNGFSLDLDQAMVDGGVFLNQGFASQGVTASGAVIGGVLNLSDSNLASPFEGPSVDALRLDDSELRGGLFIGRGLRGTGNISAERCRITGAVLIQKVSLKADSSARGYSLTLDRSSIRGNVILEASSVPGTISAVGAVVKGDVTLADLEVGGLKGDGLLLDQSNISGSLRIAIATISGQVSAAHASIGRGLTVTRSVFRNAAGVALSLEHAAISGPIDVSDLVVEGDVVAEGATFDQAFAAGDVLGDLVKPKLPEGLKASPRQRMLGQSALLFAAGIAAMPVVFTLVFLQGIGIARSWPDGMLSSIVVGGVVAGIVSAGCVAALTRVFRLRTLVHFAASLRYNIPSRWVFSSLPAGQMVAQIQSALVRHHRVPDEALPILEVEMDSLQVRLLNMWGATLNILLFVLSVLFPLATRGIWYSPEDPYLQVAAVGATVGIAWWTAFMSSAWLERSRADQ